MTVCPHAYECFESSAECAEIAGFASKIAANEHSCLAENVVILRKKHRKFLFYNTLRVNLSQPS